MVAHMLEEDSKDGNENGLDIALLETRPN
jgi:hypothetical protein